MHVLAVHRFSCFEAFLSPLYSFYRSALGHPPTQAYRKQRGEVRDKQRNGVSLNTVGKVHMSSGIISIVHGEVSVWKFSSPFHRFFDRLLDVVIKEFLKKLF